MALRPEQLKPQRVGVRMPVAFLPHGGGPWPFVDLGINQNEVARLTAYLQSIAQLPRVQPRALLVISAHWEEADPTVMSAAHPPMLYDYYGFEKAAYDIRWPAPGSPDLAQHVQSLLLEAGFACGADAERGFDHGTFVPLKLTYPLADIPTVQLSLMAHLDPHKHIAMGRALAPLRDQGVFIVASGMSFHNMRGFDRVAGANASETFGAWLDATMVLPPAARNVALAAWVQAPAARLAHPREEHLLPLMVAAGAAYEDAATVAHSQTMMGVKISGYHFG